MPAAAVAVVGALWAGSSLPPVIITTLLLLGCGTSLSVGVCRTQSWTKAVCVGNAIVVLACAFLVGAASRAGGEAARRLIVPVPIERATAVTGAVLETHGGAGKQTFIVRLAGAESEWVAGRARGTVRVAYAGAEAAVPGDGIRVDLERGARWTDSQGRFWVRGARWRVAPEHDSAAARLRGRAVAAVNRSIDLVAGTAAPLVSALLVGDGEDVDPRLDMLLVRTGTMHLLALSGMHLAVVALLVRLVVTPVLGRRLASWAAVVAAFLYLGLVGPRSGLVRASIMVGVLTALRRLDRDRPLVEALSLTLLVQLVIQPGSAGTLGFQLSYLSLLGIAVAAAPLSECLIRWLPPGLSSSVSAGASAQLATTPVLLHHFGAWYPAGVIATLVMSPLVLLTMTGGLVAVLLALSGLSAVAYVSRPMLEAVAGLVEGAGWLFSAIPGIHAVRSQTLWVTGSTLIAAGGLLAGLRSVYRRHDGLARH